MKRGTLRQAVGLDLSFSYKFTSQPSLARVAVVAFLRQFQCNGNTKHMKCQSNRHTHHLLSENDGQPPAAQLAACSAPLPTSKWVRFSLTCALLHVNIFDKICQNIPCTLFLNSLLTISVINILYYLRFTISDYHSPLSVTEFLQQFTIEPQNAHFISFVL